VLSIGEGIVSAQLTDDTVVIVLLHDGAADGVPLSVGLLASNRVSTRVRSLQTENSREPDVLDLPNTIPGLLEPLDMISNCGQWISSVKGLAFFAIAVHKLLI
jgi:hypothetical protein